MEIDASYFGGFLLCKIKPLTNPATMCGYNRAKLHCYRFQIQNDIVKASLQVLLSGTWMCMLQWFYTLLAMVDIVEHQSAQWISRSMFIFSDLAQVVQLLSTACIRKFNSIHEKHGAFRLTFKTFYGNKSAWSINRLKTTQIKLTEKHETNWN